MAEVGPTTSRWARDSYANQWNRFIAWSQASGVSSETVLGFADEMRVGLRGTVRRVWGRRGVKVRQRVQLVYRWIYVFVVVDVRRGRLLWRWIESMKSESIAEAVTRLKHHSDIEALVWDGARGHRSEVVRSVGLPTIVQPPYSPELNPAERVFEEVRRWVEGRIYGSIEEKVKAVDAYLSELASDWLSILSACVHSQHGTGSKITSNASQHPLWPYPSEMALVCVAGATPVSIYIETVPAEVRSTVPAGPPFSAPSPPAPAGIAFPTPRGHPCRTAHVRHLIPPRRLQPTTGAHPGHAAVQTPAQPQSKTVGVSPSSLPSISTPSSA